MQKVLFALALSGLLAVGCQQNSAKVSASDVPPAVLKTAKDYQVDYLSILARARKNDASGIYDLLDFHRMAEGVEGVEHGLVCLELIPEVGDDYFSDACKRFNPKRRQVILDRLLLAQGKTKKPELQQPIANWAPRTWAILNPSTAPAEKSAVDTVVADPSSTISRGAQR